MIFKLKTPEERERERERERVRRESIKSDLETQTSTLHLKHILAKLTPIERRPIPQAEQGEGTSPTHPSSSPSPSFYVSVLLSICSVWYIALSYEFCFLHFWDFDRSQWEWLLQCGQVSTLKIKDNKNMKYLFKEL